jgi:hypothetical protein
MAGIFASAQPKYADLRIATFPFDATEEVKRGPMVSHYNRMGLRASQQMMLRFPDAPGIAAMAGARNRLTVIDIDEHGPAGERLLADVQRQFGNSRVIVRTGSGGFHCYHRHAGEGRKIRPDPRRPIDLIGGGPIVLPPGDSAAITKSSMVTWTIWRRSTRSDPIRRPSPIHPSTCTCAQVEMVTATVSFGLTSRGRRIWCGAWKN